MNAKTLEISNLNNRENIDFKKEEKQLLRNFETITKKSNNCIIRVLGKKEKEYEAEKNI